jgi:NADH dehydrogenase
MKRQSTIRDRPTRHGVVIIGSGFGGLFAAKALASAPVEVTVISRVAAHVFQPLLYQVATGILSEGEIAPATRSILRRQRNTRVLLGHVDTIDLARREVVSSAGPTLTTTPYDTLIVAAGAETNYFGNPAIQKHALGLKSIDEALHIRSRIFEAFEIAELQTDSEARKNWLTFAVVGAGPTGVEMAGQIAELSQRVLRREFRSIDPSQARIVLIDGASSVLPTFSEKLRRAASGHLEQMGVELQLDHLVQGVDAAGVDLRSAGGDRSRVDARTIVWTAGVMASPLARDLAEQSGARLARGGRVEVEPDLTLPGHPEVYVIGDMAARGELPGVAQAAIQGARYASSRISRKVRGRDPGKPFAYHDKGMLATVSRFYAVASIGRLQLRGLSAWLLWLAVHLFYLVGFKNRITTLMHWTVSFVGGQRSERTGTMTRQTEPKGAPASPGAPLPNEAADVGGEKLSASKNTASGRR